MREEPIRSIRVLIVDDHVAIRVGLTSMLEAQGGIEVMGAAASGAEALVSLAAGIPDIILLDLRMHGMSGFSLIQEVRQRRSEEHTSELQSRSDLVCRLL